MKIVHVVDYFQPQLGYQESFLAKNHAEMGHDVTVLTSNRYFPFKNYEKNYKDLLGTRIIKNYKHTNLNYKVRRLVPSFEFKTFPIIPKIFDELKNIKPDLVIQHNLLKPNTYFTLKARKILNFRLIADSHAAEYNSNFDSFIKKIYILLFKTFLKPTLRESKIITTGINEKKYLYNLTQIDSKIIPLGADTSLFEPNNNLRCKVRKSYNISDNSILIVHAGKLNTDKKTDVLIDVFLNLKFQYTNIKLLLIGNSDIQIPNNKDILHVDFVKNKNLNKFLNAADIGVWPGTKSNIVTEAMSTGLPIITEKEEYAKIYITNNNGYNVGNKIELRNKLKLLIENKKLRKTMGRNSRELALEKFNWVSISKSFL